MAKNTEDEIEFEDVPNVDGERLFAKLETWLGQDQARASDAGETRQDVGQFIEDCNINKKALAHCRAVFKMDDAKRQDYLRSHDAIMTQLRPHLEGQSTQDMFTKVEDGAAQVADNVQNIAAQ